MTQPPSHATTPLRPNTFVTGKEGPAALMKVTSQSHVHWGVLLQALNYSLAPAKRMVPNWGILMKIFNLQMHHRYME